MRSGYSIVLLIFAVLTLSGWRVQAEDEGEGEVKREGETSSADSGAADETKAEDAKSEEAVSESQKAENPPSVDEELLRELGSELLEGLEGLFHEQPTGKPVDRSTSSGEQKSTVDDSSADDALFGPPGEGEDLGADGKLDPFVNIGRQMRRVEQLIAQSDTSAETLQLQKKISDSLQELLKQLQKSQQQPSSPQSSQGKKPGGNPKPGGKGNGKPGQRPGQNPGQEPGQGNPQQGNPQQGSPEQGNAAGRTTATKKILVETESTDMASMNTLIKRIWGHLPPRAREQVQNTSVDRFLPKYEHVIEGYFHRLAKDPALEP